MTPTLETATRLADIVSKGLTSGLGNAVPGQMCIEAAVCLALGEPHGDTPSCVGEPDRNFSIKLNDANWSNSEARAVGLRDLAIAQLGSADLTVDQRVRWCQYLAEQTIRKILPVALRAAASVNPAHAEALGVAALRCERDGDQASADNATDIASTAYAATAASTYAPYAAANAASTYASTTAYAGDQVLVLAAQIAVDAYRSVGAPGIALLDQLNGGPQ